MPGRAVDPAVGQRFLEVLDRYLMHPPIAQERLRYHGPRAPSTYRGRRPHPLRGEDSVACDPLEMLARLCQHIPPRGFHLTRLYEAYSNRTRGAARRRSAAERTAPGPGLGPDPTALTHAQRERRRQWARLIAKVFEVDPLRCTCGETMRIVSFLLDPAVIRKILQHLARQPEPRAHAPPAE